MYHPRTCEQIQAEMLNPKLGFGFVPPFFQPAIQRQDASELESLWQHTLRCYFNPAKPEHFVIPLEFKERLFAYLSRYCLDESRYCIVCHSCALKPLGLEAGEILEILKQPIQKHDEELDHLTDLFSKMPEGFIDQVKWPTRAEPLDGLLFSAVILIYLHRTGVFQFQAAHQKKIEELRRALKQVLAPNVFYQLENFLDYVQRCHAWILRFQDELDFKDDERYLQHHASLVSQDPELGEMFKVYRELAQREREIFEERRALEATQEALLKGMQGIITGVHELKNLLGAMTLLTGVLSDFLTSHADGITKAEMVELIKIVDELQESEDLLALTIRPYLDRTNLKKLVLQETIFSPIELIEKLIKLYQRVAAFSGVTLEFKNQCSAAEMAQLAEVYNGDPARFAEIICNLFSNALKFTHEGGKILLELRLAQSEEDKVRFDLSVRDTGCGMDAEKLDSVRQMLSSLDFIAQRAVDFKADGHGIGLVLSHCLVRKMGGQGLLVESEEGQGTVFQFYVEFSKLSVAELERYRQTQRYLAKTLAQPMPCWNILFVEDNPISSMVGMRVLEGVLKQKVTSVRLAQEAVEAYRESLMTPGANKFDFILMDIQMPINKMDGIEAIRQIRELERARGFGEHVKIISMSAGHAENEEAKRVGADGSAGKPFTRQDLQAAMMGLVSTPRARRLSVFAGGLFPTKTPSPRSPSRALAVAVDDGGAAEIVRSPLSGGAAAVVRSPLPGVAEVVKSSLPGVAAKVIGYD